MEDLFAILSFHSPHVTFPLCVCILQNTGNLLQLHGSTINCDGTRKEENRNFHSAGLRYDQMEAAQFAQKRK